MSMNLIQLLEHAIASRGSFVGRSLSAHSTSSSVLARFAAHALSQTESRSGGHKDLVVCLLALTYDFQVVLARPKTVRG